MQYGVPVSILPPVAPADRAAIVVEAVDASAPECSVQLGRKLRHAILFHQRKNSCLVGSQARVQRQHYSRFAFDFFLAVRIDQCGQHRSANAHCGFDDVR
jgi:hypothetical protein